MNLFNNKLVWSLIGTGLGIYVAGGRGTSPFRYTAGAAVGAMVLNQLQGPQRGQMFAPSLYLGRPPPGAGARGGGCLRPCPRTTRAGLFFWGVRFAATKGP